MFSYLKIITLCVSADILVTPAKLKSNEGRGKPAWGINAAMKPPKQQSTWTGILYLRPKAEIAFISSDVP